ncbi:MAG: hypothetical protein WCO78_00935 [Candidatus Roizmanbacteria bacterium]
MHLRPFFSTFSTYARRIRNIVIVVLTLVIVVQLGISLTGWGKIGTALPAGPSPVERIRKELQDKYQLAIKNTDPSAQIKTETMAGIMCSVIGELCGVDKKAPTDTNSYLHQAANLIAMPYGQPVASGVAWASDALEHAGFVPKTYAQGIGFSALGSYQRAWKVMRDAAFLLITLVIVISGFIIIFGVPVGDKAGVSIEEMLPRLVIVLIAISLSYAIVGFMIDLMYVITFLSFSTMAPLLNLDAASQKMAFVSIATGQPTSLWHLMMSNDLSPITYMDTSKALFQLLPPVAQIVVSSVVNQVGLPFLAGGMASVIPKNSTGLAGGLKNNLANFFRTSPAASIANSISGQQIAQKVEGTKTVGISLVVAIILVLMTAFETVIAPVTTAYVISALLMITSVYLFFKVFFLLFSAYVEIVIATIFAPFFILLHALPGSKSMITWIKTLGINLLTFPLVLILMMVSAFVSNAAAPPAGNIYYFANQSQQFWAPPFLNSLGSQNAIQMILGGLIFYNIPLFIDQIKKSLGYEPVFSGVSVMSFFAPVIGFASQAVGLSTKAAKLAGSIGEAGILKKVVPGSNP